MVDEMEVVSNRFSIADYVVFVIMLAVSASIGFYYACSGSKQSTAREYLMANRSMGVFPVSLSLLASFLSAVGLLGIPAEVYVFGTSYWTIIVCFLIVMPVSAYVYLPVFYDLGLTSAYEYLEKRFSPTVRKCGSVIFIFQMLMYMAIVTYAPALALSQVTGMNVWGSVAGIGIVCIFYTTVGGMKAVMWTDAFQVFCMLGAMLTVIVRGVISLGGIQAVWNRAEVGGRIDFFNFDPNPLTRQTFWGVSIGASFTWLAIYGVNQTQVQRYLTSPTKRSAQIALWLNMPALMLSLSICCFTGLILYARYWNCDPVSMKVVQTADQILPLFMMEVLGDYPGLPGFFVAGLFSGSLSTLSSGLNSLAAVTLEDFVKVLCCKNLTEERAGLVSKFIALLYGLICLGLVGVAAQLGNVLQAALSIFGMIGGPLLGLFSLGMFFPWANSKGALVGLAGGFALVLWIGVGSQVLKPPLPKLPISVVGCIFKNSTDEFSSILATPAPMPQGDEILSIYKLSYHWWASVAWISVIAIGLIVSVFTGYQKPKDLDSRLLSPIFRKFYASMPAKLQKFLCLGGMEQSADNPIASRNNGNISSVDMKGKDNPVFEDDFSKSSNMNRQTSHF